MCRQMGRHLGLRARIAILVAAGGAAVAVGVALLLSNTVNLRHSADATIRSDSYLLTVINAERLVVDAETGLRGYVITGRPLFLAPLHAAQSALPQATAALQAQAVSNHAFVNRARELARVSQSYFSGYVPSVLSMVSHNPPAARSFAVTLGGKRLVDEVRGRTATLERLVSARENARQRAARSTASAAVTEAIVVLVLLTLLTVLFGALLGRLAVARELARKRSESTTQTLQRSLLPRAMPAIPGCELAVRFVPAGPGELIGGDFYDLFPVAGGRWAIVLGDVCGKGPEAAAITSMARWTLRSISKETVAPEDALRSLNDAILHQDLGGRFLTIAYLLVTPNGQKAHVSIVCAGHPAPILVPVTGEPATVGARGTLLGVWPDIRLFSSELQLNGGESLVVFTDGVTEQGPMIKPSSVLETIRRSAPARSAQQLASVVEAHAHMLSAEQRDDIAILALRFEGQDSLVPQHPVAQRGVRR
jgi:serine phosphatase RsbU (regulator of sigma subunit)